MSGLLVAVTDSVFPNLDVAEGVEVIHSTVLGPAERAGNIPMEETVMALLTLHGSLARLVEQLSGHKVASNRRVVGEERLFAFRWDGVGQPSPERRLLHDVCN